MTSSMDGPMTAAMDASMGSLMGESKIDHGQEIVHGAVHGPMLPIMVYIMIDNCRPQPRSWPPMIDHGQSTVVHGRPKARPCGRSWSTTGGPWSPMVDYGLGHGYLWTTTIPIMIDNGGVYDRTGSTMPAFRTASMGGPINVKPPYS